MMIFLGRYFLPLLVIASNTKIVLVNNFLLKQKSITAFLSSNKYRDKPINRLSSIANVIASESLYSKRDFGMFFVAEMAINQGFAIKKHL